jgi:pantetheine-phosphate adenylyltransferase
MTTTALCPGSFDPPTNGHVDVIARAADLFDRLIVAVVDNPSKAPLFTPAERIGLMRRAVANDAIEYVTFTGLLVDFAATQGVDVLVKGLRGAVDFDYELQMAQMNRSITGVETAFIPTAAEWSFVSSSLVREVARLGGSVGHLVPQVVVQALKEKLT